MISKYRQPLGCACLLFLSVIFTKPFAEIGICDDWSYIWSARVLADTGHIVYNGWGAMMLGWQLYLGAIAIKLFGFSFTAPRLTILLVAMACTVVMHRIFARLGATETTASLATLSLVFSPLFLPLTMNFMTDIPCLFIIVLCVYLCLRAMQTESDRAALAWIATAYLSNVLGGTVRQIAWLGALVLIPTVVLYLRSRKNMLLYGTAMGVVSAACIFLWIHWFRVQDYIIPEPVFFRYHTYTLIYVFTSAFSAIFCLIPILLAVPKSKPLLLLGAGIGAAIFLFGVSTNNNYFSILDYLPFGSGTGFLGPASQGFVSINGNLAVTITTPMRFLLTAAGMALTFSAIAFVWRKIDDTVLVFVPFSAAYFFMIATRLKIYDRYYLPPIFIATLIIVRTYTKHVSSPVPRVCILAVAVYALYGIGVTQASFAFARAKIEAVKEVEAAGVTRTSIEGGFDFDGWTELEQSGHVNDIRIDHPANTYRKMPDQVYSKVCWSYFADYFPSVKPTLQLGNSPHRCFPVESNFPRVEYKTWLPPHKRYVYILDATKGM
jgi:Dolichyl-phosphate-mannose-protein mannosyltransferase